jgi:hypothetical protein
MQSTHPIYFKNAINTPNVLNLNAKNTPNLLNKNAINTPDVLVLHMSAKNTTM